LNPYIFPPAARKRLKAAPEISHTAYIFGATGYGKTELVKQFLGKRRHILDAFEQRTKAQGAAHLLPSIAALRCRLSLYEGDQEVIRSWLETAPSEDTEFFILERYRYLTKVRCYLAQGEYMLALALLERLRYYAEQFRRPYIRMEVNILSAIARHRMGMEWKAEFLATLREASGYGFVRLISEEGAAARELLRQARAEALEDKGIDRP
jgi:LuxR family maltose regulon positive regulatory protein